MFHSHPIFLGLAEWPSATVHPDLSFHVFNDVVVLLTQDLVGLASVQAQIDNTAIDDKNDLFAVFMIGLFGSQLYAIWSDSKLQPLLK